MFKAKPIHYLFGLGIILVLLIVFYSIVDSGESDEAFKKRLHSVREKRNKEIKDPAKSPLDTADCMNIKQLNFFEANKDFVVKAKIAEIEQKEMVDFPTTANTVKTYQSFYKASFSLKGKDYTLILYRAQNAKREDEEFFLPFTDKTTGVKSYKTGRYIDLKIPEKSKSVEIDFNLCYNPFCAYSNSFACPIPPKENFIDAEILAGELPPVLLKSLD